MSGREVPRDTQEAQRRASDPQASAWVSANAGSGKTFVLAQRVVRLLLEGVPPSKILCLTFTKAAAANMSMRVFATLAEWTRLDDAALAAAIEKTGAGQPDLARLTLARRLFARTVETPGGLKIQTIHAFCERLLHLFPFEANVAAGFEVIDDRRRADLLFTARETALTRAAADPQTTLGQALRSLAEDTSADEFVKLLGEALQYRRLVLRAMRRDASGEDYALRLGTIFGLRDDETLDEIDRATCENGIAPAEWADVAAVLATGLATDQKLAEFLRAAAASHDPIERRHLYVGVFMVKAGSRKAMMTSAVGKRHPDLLERLQNEQARIVALLDKRKAAALVLRSRALIIVANAIFETYETAKRYRGLLDFDDLIERTSQLLRRAEAAWVLYKLDSGIDHILIDEAQDTSSEQWDILKAVAEDFLSGVSARGTHRTFFAVGDEKQSIYSFQGAAPHMFDEMRHFFERKHRDSEKTFADVKLNMSFRSSPDILGSVDSVFALPAHRQGLSADDVATVHTAWKENLPGLVELWPAEPPRAVENPAEWRLPVDLLTAQDPPVVVAGRIARTIRAWLQPGSGEHVHDGQIARPLRAGDVLILVRTRGPFFESIIRALKEAGVPVAGADRLNLSQHIAIMDLVALGRACLLPRDDLTLACVLKSPLIGLDDDDLIALAPGRSGSLLHALEASDDPRHLAAAAHLAAWRRQAVALTPFAFYAHVLGADGGRRAMIARLGPEAGDALDEFLREALIHEQDEAPSLTQFLHRFEASEIQIKRDMEAASDAVRVMTVHAAKGLEAKVVFLPDTCGAPSGRHDPKLFTLPGGNQDMLLAWTKSKAEDPPLLAEARQASREAEEDEYRRLLYVAMTRAEERLYIAGFHGANVPKATCWYEMIRLALGPRMQEVPAPYDAEQRVLRITSAGWPPRLSGAPAASAPAIVEPLPDWLHRPAPQERAPQPPISPSNALARADQMPAPASPAAVAARDDAMAVGMLVHALLQHLPSVPAAGREATAARYLGLRAASMAPERRAFIISQVLSVMQHKALAPLFGPMARAEVAVAGRIVRPGRAFIDIAGQIDRVVDTGEEILIADFKTGAAPTTDATPQAYLLQLALYRAALQPLWPGRRLRAFLVWTSGPVVRELSGTEMDAALAAL
jgi:ATP-dependent helicase/nuclease subunit A